MLKIECKEIKLDRNTIVTFVIAAVLLGILIGCGGDNDGSSGKPKKGLSHIYEKLGPYQGWEKVRFYDVVFIYSPDHPEKEELENYARVLSAISRMVSSFLSIVPPDSLTVYFYPNAKHGITVTGFFAPFAESEVIHLWMPSKIGQPVSKLLISKWSDKEPKYKFLREGIITLFDATGVNYHVSTTKLIESGGYIPLSKLAVDTTVNADRERTQSALAASFVDYVVYVHGIDKLKALYEADSKFESEVELIFSMPVDSLEKNWLDLVEQIVTALPDSLKK